MSEKALDDHGRRFEPFYLSAGHIVEYCLCNNLKRRGWCLDDFRCPSVNELVQQRSSILNEPGRGPLSNLYPHWKTILTLIEKSSIVFCLLSCFRPAPPSRSAIRDRSSATWRSCSSSCCLCCSTFSCAIPYKASRSTRVLEKARRSATYEIG